MGRTSEHSGGERSSSKGVAHGPTGKRLSGRNDRGEGGKNGFGVICSGGGVRRIVSIAGLDRGFRIGALGI